jgi:hypothetical protein
MPPASRSGDVVPRSQHTEPGTKLCYAVGKDGDLRWIDSMPDATDEVPISHLQRRKIESRVLIPFIAACREKFGDAATRDLVVDLIRRLGMADGARWGDTYGHDMGAIKEVAEKVWAGGGSLDIEMIAAGDDRLDFNVKRCAMPNFTRSLASRNSAISCTAIAITP